MRVQLGLWIAAAIIMTGSMIDGSAARAASGSDFDYPELMVTPRASERLATEAAQEPSRRWTSWVPIQVSAVASLGAGIDQLTVGNNPNDVGNASAYAGIAIGGIWLLTTLGIEAFYQPYIAGQGDVSVMPSHTTREQLVRERYSEEIINAQARLAWRLKWLSVLTNAGADIYMAGVSKSGSVATPIDALAAALALTPLLFRLHWQDVADEQDSYKKRIYGPVASATMLREPGTGNVAPGAVLSLSF